MNQQKLHGLALTAAVQICAHPEIAVILGGSEDRRNPIDVIASIIEGTFSTGLNYIKVDHERKVVEEVCWLCHKLKGQPPDRCPGHYDMSGIPGLGLLVKLEPLDIQCVCGHRYLHHFRGNACTMDECQCVKFNSGYTDEESHHVET